MYWLLILAALAAGMANPFQSGLNSQLNKQLGQPLWTAVIVYATGLILVAILQMAFGGSLYGSLPGGRLASVSWWAWLGGAVSVVSTVVGLMIAQRMGSGIFTGASITAAMVTSILLDHFGLIGFRQHTASPARIAGCALMIGGLWMIARY